MVGLDPGGPVADLDRVEVIDLDRDAAPAEAGHQLGGLLDRLRQSVAVRADPGNPVLLRRVQITFAPSPPTVRSSNRSRRVSARHFRRRR